MTSRITIDIPNTRPDDVKSVTVHLNDQQLTFQAGTPGLRVARAPESFPGPDPGGGDGGVGD